MHRLRTLSTLLTCSLAVSEAYATDTNMSGEVIGQSLNLPTGSRIIATSDLRIVCSQDVVIEGIMFADPGAKIEIVANAIHVRGGTIIAATLGPGTAGSPCG